MKESRKVYDWLLHGGNAAVGCSSMRLTPGEENTTVVIMSDYSFSSECAVKGVPFDESFKQKCVSSKYGI